MTRAHDMGGRFGDGPVIPEPQGIPEFEDDWQGRALAITLACGFLGQWNIDESRHSRERLSPKDYARFSYFEKWIAALTDMLVAKGILTPDDLRPGANPERHPLAEKALTADSMSRILARGGRVDRPETIPVAFSVGQAVRTLRPAANRLVDGGHTRLPIYAAGARGRILRQHGTHVFPDSNAHGLGEAPEPIYAVAFPARELWAAPEHPNDEVVLDLWQSYLEPA